LDQHHPALEPLVRRLHLVHLDLLHKVERLEQLSQLEILAHHNNQELLEMHKPVECLVGNKVHLEYQLQTHLEVQHKQRLVQHLPLHHLILAAILELQHLQQALYLEEYLQQGTCLDNLKQQLHLSRQVK
jgi:hypothetical protein